MNKPAASSPRPLRAKLGIKEEYTTLLLDVPGDVLAKIVPLPTTTHVKVSRSAVYDFVLAFVETPDQLEELWPRIRERIAPTAGVWVAWRKQRTGFQPFFGFTEVQHAGLLAGLVDVKVCSISDVWSGLKFMIRREDR